MISIALTTYNGEKYLSQQIDSILAQSIKNFELIICDDKSTDDTVKIIKQYISEDSRIKLYVNEKNLGFKKNFEKALSLCNGEFIALCDQDDIWEINHLEILFNNIENNYLICGNNLLFTETSPETISFFQSNYFSNSKYPTNNDILKKILYSGSCFQGASMLLSRDFLNIALPIPTVIPFHDCWLVFVACCFNKFKCTEEIVTNYRQHEKQVTKQKIKSNFSKERENLINIENDLYKNYFDFFNDALFYHKNQTSILNRLKTIKIWKKNYFYIYPKRKLFFLALIKYILKGLY